MRLSTLSIQRPVLATVFSLVILIFGFIGLQLLGIREFPSVDPPIITVSTNYTGASAEIIESQITEPLEEEINGVAGIRSITSTSRDGRSTIQVEFNLEVDLDAAANDVRDRVSRAVTNLPPDSDPPAVEKADADAFPIIFISIKSEKRNLLELSEIANKRFKERLQTINGVSDVGIWGEKQYAMRLWLNPEKLASYQLTPLDVVSALRRENVELPSGAIEGQSTEMTVRTQGRLVTPADFDNLVIRESGDIKIRLSDVGYAELGPANSRTILRRDGIPMVGNAITAQPGSNSLEIADAVYERLEQISKDLPEDVEWQIGFDNTTFVRRSIKEVEETIFLAFGLVVLIIFLFLRDWRTTLVPVLAIPISLIGSFFIMWAAGFTINVLSLLGIVLAIGIVVDDAIVVLENIYAKIEKGIPPKEAAVQGSIEIFFAVVATTVALVAVFFPIIFLQGLTGRLFREFGVTIAGSVIISSFVALTLTPMLSARLLRRHDKPNWLYRVTEPFFVGMANGSGKVLAFVLNQRWIALVAMGLSIAIIVGLFNQIPTELAPLEDRSQMRLSATGPEGATFGYMEDEMAKLFDFVNREVPEAAGIVTITSPSFGASSSVNNGFIRLILKDPSQRERSQQEIADELAVKVRQFSGSRVSVIQEPTIGDRRSGLPVQFVIQAATQEKLREVLPKFLEKAQKDPRFSFADVNLKFNKPELKVEINRDKAKSLGISIQDVAQTLQLALSGQRFDYYIQDGKQYQVIGQLQRAYRDDPSDLRQLYVRSASGQMVQLDNLVTISEQINPPQRFRYNRYSSATVSASLSPGVTLGQGIEGMREIAAEVLDPSFVTSLSGSSRDLEESSSSLMYAFILAVVLIYLVLAAQFESFRDPVIILLTVPLALAGAIGSLYLTDQSLNIFSQIGIIMLIGLVSKNGILIVEFANQRREQGLSLMDAIYDASVSRFRPILMTSLSTILGVLPIALALGAGSESRVSMGIAVVGGLVFSTFLTLFVVPVMYAYISKKHRAKIESVENLESAAVEQAHP